MRTFSLSVLRMLVVNCWLWGLSVGSLLPGMLVYGVLSFSVFCFVMAFSFSLFGFLTSSAEGMLGGCCLSCVFGLLCAVCLAVISECPPIPLYPITILVHDRDRIFCFGAFLLGCWDVSFFDWFL